MNNTVELNNKLNTYLDDEVIDKTILDAMNKASTIEELLIIKWQSKLRKVNRALRNKILHKNIERISYNNALENASAIIYDLINNNSLESIKNKYNVTTSSIKNLVTTYLLKGKYKDELLKNNILFNETINPNQDRELLSARVAIKLFIDNGCYTNKTVCSKFSCKAEEYYKYVHILNAKNDPLYKEFEKLNKAYTTYLHTEAKSEYYNKLREVKRKNIENVSTMDPSSILEILSSPNIEDRNYINFCIYYGLNSRVLQQLLNDNDDLKYELTSNLDKESVTNI